MKDVLGCLCSRDKRDVCAEVQRLAKVSRKSRRSPSLQFHEGLNYYSINSLLRCPEIQREFKDMLVQPPVKFEAMSVMML